VSTPFIGEVRLFGGDFAPVGWAFCDGSLVSIAAYDALFNLIGTTYGGDGTETFALPDLRGRVPIGQGQGPGLTPRPQGESFGSEAMPLTVGQLPEHAHGVRASETATTTKPKGAVPAAGGPYAAAPAAGHSFDKLSQLGTGGNQPHDNMAPFLTISYIIALDGVYPAAG
jgi:microcystin-dependent protein